MWLRLRAVLCMAGLMLGVHVCAAGEEKLKIYTENYPPYNYEGEGGKNEGVSIEIVAEIMKRLGDTTPVEMGPWNRAYQICQKEKNTVLFSMTRTEARETMFKWVGPLAPNNWVLFAKKGSGIKVANLEDLKKYKIGTYLNDAAEQYLKEQGLESQLQSVNDDRLNAKKLLAGRIDLWVGGDLQIPFKTKQAGEDVSQLEKVMDLKQTTLFIAFNKDTPDEVVARWQKTLDEMKKDGTYDTIMKKYK